MKGGGDAVSAARAVLQTGEYDYAWNLQVEDEMLQAPGRPAARARSHIVAGRQHRAHPAQRHRPVDRGRRRARRASRPSTPTFSDPAVRQAMSACWSTAESVAEVHLRPHRHRDRELPQQPAALPLEEHEVRVQRRQGQRASSTRPAGRRARDGIRAKDGKKLKFVFQTSINAPRQKTQAIVKQACQKAGIEIELKSVHGLGVLLVRRRPTPTPIRISTPTCRCTRRP